MAEFITIPRYPFLVVLPLLLEPALLWSGIPYSSSNTLIGGFAVGAGMTHGQALEALISEVLNKTLMFIVTAPLIGMDHFEFITIVKQFNSNFWLKNYIIVTVFSACVIFIKFN